MSTRRHVARFDHRLQAWCVRILGGESSGQAAPPGGWDTQTFRTYAAAKAAADAVEQTGCTVEQYLTGRGTHDKGTK